MYTIGQVLYVILAKKSQVYPMQVIEVITKKSLAGEEIRYLLQAGAEKSSTIFLDQVEGEIFDDAENAKRVLVQRATQQVIKLVEAATIKAKEWYIGGTREEIPLQKIDNLDDLVVGSPTREKELDHGVQTVVLPDGTVAKVKLPTSL